MALTLPPAIPIRRLPRIYRPAALDAAAAATPAADAAKAPGATEGTLHRPSAKAADKKPAKKAAKPAGSTWVDDAAKRRGIKTRGDSGGGRDRSRPPPRNPPRYHGSNAAIAPS